MRATSDKKKARPPESVRLEAFCEELLLLGAAYDAQIEGEKMTILMRRYAVIRKAQARRNAIRNGVGWIGDTLVTVKKNKIDLLADCAEAAAICSNDYDCEAFFVSCYMHEKPISAILMMLKECPEPDVVKQFMPVQGSIFSHP